MKEFFNWLRGQWGRKEQPPAFWQDYLADCRHKWSLQTPLEEVSFVVLDTETTGLSVKTDRILSIGALRIRGWEIKVEESLDLFVRQVYEPEQSVVEIHGILPKDRDDSLEEAEAIRYFLNFIGNSVLVGHHLSFDTAMINAGLQRASGGKLRNLTVDTIDLARRLMPPSPLTPPASPGLDDLCREYHIALNDRHTAAGDAFLTALLFFKLTARLRKRKVHTLRDLLRRP